MFSVVVVGHKANYKNLSLLKMYCYMLDLSVTGSVSFITSVIVSDGEILLILTITYTKPTFLYNNVHQN